MQVLRGEEQAQLHNIQLSPTDARHEHVPNPVDFIARLNLRKPQANRQHGQDIQRATRPPSVLDTIAKEAGVVFSVTGATD